MIRRVLARFETTVRAEPVVLFMKGTRQFPQCGFSAVVVEALDRLGVDYAAHDVLGDPELRHGIKHDSDRPRSFMSMAASSAAADIVREMNASGELDELLRSGARAGEAA